MKLLFKYEIDTKDPIFPSIISWENKENAEFPKDFDEYDQQEILKDYLIDELKNLLNNQHDCKDCVKLDIDQFITFISD